MQLTPQQAEQMRALLAEFDKANNAGPVREFDLNNPPVKRYVHQEFPKHVYDAAGKFKVVADKEQEAAALAAGYSLEPISGEANEAIPAEENEAEEIARLDKLARTKKKN